jgi:hypothetical protein
VNELQAGVELSFAVLA